MNWLKINSWKSAIIKEAIGIVRKEDNTSIDLKITFFILKYISASRWVLVFVSENILKLIGKFYDILEVIDFIFNLFLFIIIIKKNY